MNKFFAALMAVLSLAACSKNVSAKTENAETAGAAAIAAYEPMAAFAPLAGKIFRGEWSEPEGTAVVDIAKYELILNGRALQSTHRIEGKDYGGRTIFFYDEGAKNYVYHYFTTAGFHTTGAVTMTDGGFSAEEKVEGHETIGSVRSNVTFGADEMLVDVVYVGKDGSESAGGARIYKPIAEHGPLFPDTE